MQVVFLSDDRPMLQAMDTEKERELTSKLADLSKQKRVALQWIPANCGIPGNERADQLAKQGARDAQPTSSLRFSERKIIANVIQPTGNYFIFPLLMSRSHD